MVGYLDLPFSARNKVVGHLEPHEILFLSLLSRRSKNSLRESKINHKGFRITSGTNNSSWEDPDEKRLDSVFGETKQTDKTIVKWKYVNNLDTLDLFEEFEFLRKTYGTRKSDLIFKAGGTLKVNGLECRYSISFDRRTGIPTLYLEKCSMKKWPMELYNHVTDLFQPSTGLEFALNLTDTLDFPESLEVKDLFLLNNGATVPSVDFLEKVKVLNSVHIAPQRIQVSIPDSSKIWRTPNLTIHADGLVLPRQIPLFKGKNARFRMWNAKGQDLNGFIKHWLSTENTVLESIGVCGCNNLDGVLEGIQASKWDPKKRQRRFVSKAPNREKYLYTYDYKDCANAMDIERSDGLLASIRIEEKDFFMFVWHKRFNENPDAPAERILSLYY